MVRCWRGLAVVGLVLVPLLLAGCTSDDPPKAPDEALDETEDLLPSDPTRDPTLIDVATAVVAPVLQVGQSWTYDVSGSRPGSEYTVTIGVVADAGDHYVLGADNGREFEERYIWRNTLFMDGVQKDTFAFMQSPTFQDIIGFKRGIGETWEAILFGNGFEMTKVTVGPVTHAAGTAQGIRAQGSGDGGTLVVEYASDVEGITLFEWDDGSGKRLVYRLTGAKASDTTGLMRWESKMTEEAHASGGFSTLTAGSFESDGTGQIMFLVAEARPARIGRGTALDPDNNQVIAVESPAEGQARAVANLPDKAGTWRLFAAANEGFVQVVAYQVTVTAY